MLEAEVCVSLRLVGWEAVEMQCVTGMAPNGVPVCVCLLFDVGGWVSDLLLPPSLSLTRPFPPLVFHT